MTDNEKLARWQELTNFIRHLDTGPVIQWVTPTGNWTGEPPDYLNDDSAAMSLLDTLVEKDINYSMTGWKNDGVPVHTIEVDHVDLALIHAHATIRREAVVAAVLELVEKEGA